MRKEDSDTRQRIISVTRELLANFSSSEIRIADVAKSSSVGIQTIYYHFESRGNLVAEAQMSNYCRLTQSIRDQLALAESASDDNDEEEFWKAIGDSMNSICSIGHGGDRWMIPKMLIDIWADTKTQLVFCDHLEDHFDRWISLIEVTKLKGWVRQEMSTDVFLTLFWANLAGQSIFSNTTKVEMTPQDARDVVLIIARSNRGNILEQSVSGKSTSQNCEYE